MIESLINKKDKNEKRLFNNTYIDNYLGVHKSTISKEFIKRHYNKIFKSITNDNGTEFSDF